MDYALRTNVAVATSCHLTIPKGVCVCVCVYNIMCVNVQVYDTQCIMPPGLDTLGVA